MRSTKRICDGQKNMGTTLSHSSRTIPRPQSGGISNRRAARRMRAVTRQLNLTAREIEVCLLHFIEGRSQLLIAGWLGVTPQCIRQCIANAMAKQPALHTLRKQLRAPRRRPRLVHLSQIDNPRDRDRGPFNADEI